MPSQMYPVYKNGVMITDAQLNTGQQYHKELREFWDKTLYGWGIIGEKSFQLSIDADGKIRLSNGVAITSTNVALLSDADFFVETLSPTSDDNYGLAIIKGEPSPDSCELLDAPDGENQQEIFVRDTVVGDIEWLKDLSKIEDSIRRHIAHGHVIVGLLERQPEQRWFADKRYRQQGPLSPPGSHDATRIANAIWVSSALQRLAVSKLRSLIGKIALAIGSMIALLIAIFCVIYVPRPNQPDRVFLDAKYDLRGPIAGRTYSESVFAVKLTDYRGWPIKGKDVVFELDQPADDPIAVFLGTPVSLDRPAENDQSFNHRIVVKTNYWGVASPEGLRFRALESFQQRVQEATQRFNEAAKALDATPGDTNLAAKKSEAQNELDTAKNALNAEMAKPLRLSIFVPNTPLHAPIITRTLHAVVPEVNGFRFVGNFAHHHDDSTVNKILEELPIDKAFEIRGQILSGLYPVGLDGLDVEFTLRRLKDGQSPIKHPLNFEQFDLVDVKQTKREVIEKGKNSWITVKIHPLESEGTYTARIEVKKEKAILTTADLVFRVMKQN